MKVGKSMKKIWFIINLIIFTILIALFPTLFLYDDLEVATIRWLLYFAFTFISSLLTYSAFNLYTNKYPLNMDKYMRRFSVLKAIKIINGRKTITFIREGSKFICEDKSFSKVIIDLDGYMFKKTYIANYVTRNIRYKEVSGNIAFFNNFFKKKLHISVIDNLNLIIIDNDKEYKMKIIENNYSKISILNKLILGSKHAKYSSVPRRTIKQYSDMEKRNRTTYIINEEMFQEGRFGLVDRTKKKRKR